MYGGSTNAGALPATDKFASTVASPTTFLAISLTLPVRYLMLPTSVRRYKSSSATVSITALLLGFNLTPFKYLQRTNHALNCIRVNWNCFSQSCPQYWKTDSRKHWKISPVYGTDGRLLRTDVSANFKVTWHKNWDKNKKSGPDKV